MFRLFLLCNICQFIPPFVSLCQYFLCLAKLKASIDELVLRSLSERLIACVYLRFIIIWGLKMNNQRRVCKTLLVLGVMPTLTEQSGRRVKKNYDSVSYVSKGRRRGRKILIIEISIDFAYHFR